MNSLIKQYINNLTIDNVKNFGIKNNIFLNNDELNIIYDIIKNEYHNLLNGQNKEIKKRLKSGLTENNYKKTMKLYDEYLKKYQGYLW